MYRTHHVDYGNTPKTPFNRQDCQNCLALKPAIIATHMKNMRCKDVSELDAMIWIRREWIINKKGQDEMAMVAHLSSNLLAMKVQSNR